MKKLPLFIVVLAMAAACGKKDRLSVSTAEMKIEPGACVINHGGQQAFSARGITYDSREIGVDPIWSVDPVSLGKFTPVQGKTTVFSAQDSGLGTVRASWSDMIGEADIAVKDANGLIVDNTYGIFSETDPLRLTIEINGYFGVFTKQGSGATISTEDIISDVQEGSLAKQITVQLQLAPSWAGCYFQYGPEDEEDLSVYINMDHYKNGYLRFWIKSPIDLEVGIRSVNQVNSDTNPLKIVLNASHYFEHDGQWHAVAVKLSEFESKGVVEWTKMKNLFIISALSSQVSIGDTHTFFIDHVRWEK